MKTRYIIALLACMAFAFQGCKVGNVASSQSLSDQAFIYVESTSKYPESVQVALDKDITFNAKVYPPKKHLVKGETYAVATGKRHVTVSYRGKTIYERTLMLSTQQTYKITLP